MVRNSPQIFALFGNPIGHSLSPLVHNAAFKRMKIDAQLCPFLRKKPGGCGPRNQGIGYSRGEYHHSL